MINHAMKKNRESDIILVLKPIEGKKPLASSGMVDSRLFTGKNQLHAVQDTSIRLWHLKYDMGILQEPLRQRFTTLDKLLEFVTGYFARRNIEIVEIKD